MADWLAGQRITTGRLNAASLPGELLFTAYRTAAQSMPSRAGETTADGIQWDDVQYDPYGGWSAGAPTKWVSPFDGFVQLNGMVGYASSTAGTYREAVWYVNATSVPGGHAAQTVGTGGFPAVQLTAQAPSIVVPVAFGDYIELMFLHNVGANLNTGNGAFRSRIDLIWAGSGA